MSVERSRASFFTIGALGDGWFGVPEADWLGPPWTESSRLPNERTHQSPKLDFNFHASTA